MSVIIDEEVSDAIESTFSTVGIRVLNGED